MADESRERWKILCEQAVHETDPDRFLKLIREINRLLEDKATRIEPADSRKGLPGS